MEDVWSQSDIEADSEHEGEGWDWEHEGVGGQVGEVGGIEEVGGEAVDTACVHQFSEG